jgi:hypothetical protein
MQGPLDGFEDLINIYEQPPRRMDARACTWEPAFEKSIKGIQRILI